MNKWALLENKKFEYVVSRRFSFLRQYRIQIYLHIYLALNVYHSYVYTQLVERVESTQVI